MTASDLRLLVNGRSYGGWEAIRVGGSLSDLAGSFDLGATDRWPAQREAWAIQPEDECRVEIDGEPVIDGYVEKCSPSMSSGARSLSYSGRDKAAALLDSSVMADQWSYRNKSILEVAKILAEPFGIRVSLQPGVVLPRPPPAKTTVNPGDGPYDVLERMARTAGVLLLSDGLGGLVIGRAGTARTKDPIVEGGNLLDAQADYDGAERFATYTVLAHAAGGDWLDGEDDPGEAVRLRGDATDEGVRRRNRVKVIPASEGLKTTAEARARADWEARVRAARSESLQVSVRGWRQSDGALWPLNAIVATQVPSCGAARDLLIAERTFTIDQGGERTTMRLTRPDAFLPEPLAAKVKGSGIRDWLKGDSA